MATLLHGESRRMYSWWWDSHISPKNSKWLKENLTDMDMKVKAMIRLLEEDADSFARRAEMYYKKRPELMKLVEEFYRAYRALAERYDHATGALRQAHRTMAEAFPNQVPLMLPDESPSGSSGMEVEPHTPELSPPVRALFEPDDFQKDALGLSTHLCSSKRNGAYSEESDVLSSKKGLKQLNDLFATGEGALRTNLSEGNVRKGLNFHEEAGKGFMHKSHDSLNDVQKQEVKEKEDFSDKIKSLQEEITQLSTENQNLKIQVTSQSEHTEKAETEIQSLKDALSKIESEKDSALLQYQQSIERITALEIQFSHTQNDFNKLHDEMLEGVKMLNSAKELNQSLQLELDALDEKAKLQQQELKQKQEELEAIHISLQEERQLCRQAEMAGLSMEKLLTQSQEEVKILGLEIQEWIEKLKKVEQISASLREEMHKLKEDNGILNEQILAYTLKIKDLEEEITFLKETEEKLHDEVGLHVAEKELLQKYLYSLAEEKNDLDKKCHGLVEQVETVRLKAEEEVHKLKEEVSHLNEQNLTNAQKINDLQAEIIFLKETKEKLHDEVGLYVAEKELLQKELYSLADDRNDLDQKYQDLVEKMKAFRLKAEEEAHKLKEENDSLNEQNLAYSHKINDLQEEITFLKETEEKLHDEVGLHVAQKELLQKDLYRLTVDRNDLDKKYHGLVEQVEVVRLKAEEELHKLKEEVCHLNEQNLTYAQKINDLQEEIIFLKETKEKLHDEVGLYVAEKELLQKELSSLAEDRNDLDQKYQDIVEQMKDVRLKADEEVHKLKEEIGCLSEENLTYAQKINDVQEEMIFLKERKDKLHDEVELHVAAKQLLQEDLYHLTEDRNDLDRKCHSLVEQVEVIRLKAEEEVHKLKEEIGHLNEQNLSYAQKINDLQEEIIFLKETKEKLHDEVGFYVAEKDSLQKELYSLTEDRNDLDQKHQDLVEQMKAVSLKAEEEVHKQQEENRRLNEQNLSSALKINNLQDEIVFLMQAKGKLEDDVVLHVMEKEILEQELHGLTENKTDLEQRHQSLMEQMEAVKLKAEEEVCNLKEEIDSLNEQHLSSALKIKVLQEEIILLKETQAKLEDEVGLHIKEKEILEQELYQLREEKNDIERRHSALMEQMEAVSSNVGSLQESVEELRQGNTEMKEVCKRHEVEKELLLEKLKNMENILEKNALLENSLSDANVELEVLREKITALEESQRSTCKEISSNIAEKAALALQVESLAQNVENLLHKNTFLEKSLYDVSTELESLRVKLKEFEESCESLSDQKTSLLLEKSSLILQVECISQDRETLDGRCADLEEKCASLSREKDFILGQVEELQGLLKSEKYEREALVKHHNAQLAELENQIHVLQEENRVLQQQFELEQHKLMDALIETFILQRSVFDIREKNSVLSTECQKHVELSGYQEKVISQLEQENHTQKREIAVLVDHFESLRKGIHVLMKALNTSKDSAYVDEIKEEIFLHILEEIKGLQNSITNAEDEIQKMHLETSVLITLLVQMGLNLAYLSSEKSILVQKIETRTEELLAFQNKNQELMGMNDNLSHDLRASNQMEEMLKAELEILHLQLSDLREAHATSQVEFCKLLIENQSLSKELYNLREKHNALEEENSEILAEVMTLEHLHVFFRSHSSERALDLKLFVDDLECLQLINNDLNQTIRELNGKIYMLEVENMQLKESVVYVEELRSHVVILEFELCTSRNSFEELNLQLTSSNNLLIQRELELSDAYQRIQSVNERNTELCEEIRVLHEIVGMAQGEIHKLRNKVEVHLVREDNLNSELQKSMHDVERCEEDIATLLSDAQVSSITATLYEEKIFELLAEGERLQISDLVQKDILNREIALQVDYVNELLQQVDDLESKNKGLEADLVTYLPFLTSLRDKIASLEEHTLSLSKIQASSNHQEQETSSWEMQQSSGQDMSLVPLQDTGSCELSRGHSATVQEGVSLLQKLNAKVEVLQKMIIDFRSLLEQERLEARANLEGASKEINGLRTLAVAGRGQGRKEFTAPQNEGRVIDDESEISRVKYGQKMKDIQLDKVSSSLASENGDGLFGLKGNKYAESDDQMLQLWETAERDCNNPTWKSSGIAVEHDIETVEEEKSEYPSSELAAAKELSVDKLEIPKRASEYREEWSRSIQERLAADAQRLSVLQTSMEDLKRKMEGSEKGKHPTNLEYATIKVQLREAEGAILELVDINSKLTKKAEDYSVSSDGMHIEPEDTGSAGRMQISERASRNSEKIGKLELELHKIQYILLKLEEEHHARTKAADRKTSVLLREYLYGRRDSRRQKKKRSFCGCMRPRTEGDN